MNISILLISCNRDTVSSIQVPFPTTITSIFCFVIISLNFIFAESEEWRNILSKRIGVHSLSRTTILHHALYHGSIANTCFPYSGFVNRSAARFFWKLVIASSSPSSFISHLHSFSTDLKSASYQSLKASARSGINCVNTCNMLAYSLLTASIHSSFFSTFTLSIQIFSHLLRARI